MASRCFPTIGGLVARFTRLDACCAPVAPGTPCGFAVTKFIEVTLEPDIEEATEFTQKLADDTLCINESGCPQLKGYDLTLTLCNYDPELFDIILGFDLYTDFDGVNTGFFSREDFGNCPKFAMEVWSRGSRAECDPDPDTLDRPYNYNLFPCVGSASLSGGFTFSNDINTIEISAKAKASGAWGHGPYCVVPADVSGTPSALLTPITAQQPSLTVATSVPPPTAACGCQTMPAYTLPLAGAGTPANCA